MTPTPDSAIVDQKVEIDRQRRYGLLRAQQRAAMPIIVFLRENGLIPHRHAAIEIQVLDDEAIDIRVSVPTLTQNELEKLKKGVVEP